jgi:hypothetical protein
MPSSAVTPAFRYPASSAASVPEPAPRPASDAFADGNLTICVDCGYDLRGIGTLRCPECGTDYDPAAPTQLPWSRRGEIGPLRAFLLTASAVTRRRRTLAREIARPLSAADARLFRTVIAALLALSLSPWLFLTHYPIHLRGSPPLAEGLGLRGPDALPFVAATFAGLWGWCWAATGAGGHLFARGVLSEVHRGRAFVIGRYACAPLGLLPLFPPLGAAAGLIVRPAEFRPADVALGTAGIATFVGLALTWGWSLACGGRLLRRSTLCGRGRAAAYVATAAFSTAATAALYLLALPLLVAYITAAARGLAE